MDPSDALVILTELRTRVGTLREQPAPGGELFQQWYEVTVRALDQIYGPRSPEKREFLAIRFEISPTHLRAAERLVTEAIQELGGTVPTDLPLGQDIYYDRRLIDADVFLFALINQLRNR